MREGFNLFKKEPAKLSPEDQAGRHGTEEFYKRSTKPGRDSIKTPPENLEQEVGEMIKEVEAKLAPVLNGGVGVSETIDLSSILPEVQKRDRQDSDILSKEDKTAGDKLFFVQEAIMKKYVVGPRDLETALEENRKLSKIELGENERAVMSNQTTPEGKNIALIIRSSSYGVDAYRMQVVE